MSASFYEKAKSLLAPDEIITPESPLYEAESSVMAAQKQRSPKLVIRPTSVESLQRVLPHLASEELDIAVRSQGYGSSSAKDVVLSMSAFDEFEFDRENEIVILGAGQPWSSYYEKMERVTPDYAVVACRTPAIGVGGSTLSGGFSWLSSEYGCLSDPENLLDAEVVKLDGSVVWASNEPDLLWALRGTQGGFGVVTKFKFRAYRYPQLSWGGILLLPWDSLPQTASSLAQMASREDQPKVAMHLFVMKMENLKLLGIESKTDMLVVMAFDAYGEEHGRSEEGFKWAIETPGAIDSTRLMSLQEFADLQKPIEAMKGKTQLYWAPFATSVLTEDVILRSFEWYQNGLKAGGSIPSSTYVLFEIKSINPNGNTSGSGWPRPPGLKHQVVLGIGCQPDASPQEHQKAVDMIKKGPVEILGGHAEINMVPNLREEFHEVGKIFGPHQEKLRELKRKYDPRNRLGGPFAT